jgi:hypothetical protein
LEKAANRGLIDFRVALERLDHAWIRGHEAYSPGPPRKAPSSGTTVKSVRCEAPARSHVLLAPAFAA